MTQRITKLCGCTGYPFTIHVRNNSVGCRLTIANTSQLCIAAYFCPMIAPFFTCPLGCVRSYLKVCPGMFICLINEKDNATGRTGIADFIAAGPGPTTAGKQKGERHHGQDHDV